MPKYFLYIIWTPRIPSLENNPYTPQLKLGYNIKILLKTEWSLIWSSVRTSSNETGEEHRGKPGGWRNAGRRNRAGTEAGAAHSAILRVCPPSWRETRKCSRAQPLPLFSPVKGVGGTRSYQQQTAWKEYLLPHRWKPAILKSHRQHFPH